MHETQNDKFGSQYVAWLTFAFFIVAGIVVYVFTTANPNSALGMLMRGRPLPGVNRVQPYPTSSLKPDEFRLTVSHVVDNSDQLLVHLTIDTLQPQWHEISSRGTLWLGQNVGKASS
ncbi:MAG: hypothetical protein KDA78_09580, partial [Planctomycetaceae bacterium]|nr:hypothetical protein [Planctomycetaceae bacterium]